VDDWLKKSPIDKEAVFELETGMLLLHKHGNDCMLVSVCDAIYFAQ
jgi:hypothetical protein